MGIAEGTTQLNTGALIPLIGLGTATRNLNDEEIKAAVTTALQVGYRHFDTASFYGTEHALREALNSSFWSGIVNREDVFVTSKLGNTEHDDPIAAIKNSLKYRFLLTDSVICSVFTLFCRPSYCNISNMQEFTTGVCGSVPYPLACQDENTYSIFPAKRRRLLAIRYKVHLVGNGAVHEDGAYQSHWGGDASTMAAKEVERVLQQV
ncbi:uncharacterized protein LOC131035524 isoform X2 [Cryptomeria japonica]|uniref:uncharacterized protein LOC131035524 isoform X2 n=1 Tax=Cryptomeria japonica TaxID=3369 RepID=UPI0027DAA900|nr:uncharacterized protein LOC131035524 isoform X2 [Cryptomeria japonica]